MLVPRRPRHTWRVFALALAIFALTGDRLPRPLPPPILDVAAARFVATPAVASPTGIAWLSDPNEIVVSLYTPDPVSERYPLYALPSSASQFTPIQLPDDPSCSWIERNSARLLSDGRVGFIQDCGGLQEGLAEHLLAYDPRSGQTTALVPYALPSYPGVFDLSPDLHSGLIDYGDRIFESLDWLDPTEAKPVPVQLAFAEWPSWSPDGRSIALVGAQNDEGLKGIDRLDLPKDIYLMQPGDLRLRLLVPNVAEARTPRWSPDGQWLLIPMRFEEGRVGLWLVNATTGQLYHLLETSGDVMTVSWSPDAKSIAVLIERGSSGGSPGDQPTGLYIFPTPDLIRLANSGNRS